MKQLTLEVSSRKETGRGPAKRLRASGQVPGVIYGKSGSFSLSVEESKLRQMMRASAGAAAIVHIQGLEGQESVRSLVKEVKRDACTDRFVHIDFQEITAGEAISLSLPIHFTGESDREDDGGVLDFQTHELHIKCRARDLPEYIEVSVADLKIGNSVHIKDLPAIENVTFLDNEDLTIVACAAPKVEEEPEEEAPEAEEGAESEGESEEKAESSEGEAADSEESK